MNKKDKLIQILDQCDHRIISVMQNSYFRKAMNKQYTNANILVKGVNIEGRVNILTVKVCYNLAKKLN